MQGDKGLHDGQRLREGISPSLDQLSSELLGDALDLLAEGKDVGALLVIQDAAGVTASFEFSDDDPAACLEAARTRVRALARQGADEPSGLGKPLRYAMAYEGAVADDMGVYRDALLLEFGEHGWQSYSAYCFFKGKGARDNFSWTEAAPAGEVAPLL